MILSRLFLPVLLAISPMAAVAAAPKVQSQNNSSAPSDGLAVDAKRAANALETIANHDKSSTERANDAASLKAQQDTATWALIALFISVAQALIGIAGLVWIKRTLDATQAAVENAAAANAIAQSGVATAKQATESQLRAWLSLDVKLQQSSKSTKFAHFTAQVSAKNIGQTPALDIVCKRSITLAIQNRTHPPKPAIFGSAGSIVHPLMPGENARQRYGERIAISAITEAYAKASPRDTPIVVLDIALEYRTVFDAKDAPPHVTSARFLIHPPWGPNRPPDTLRDWLNGPTSSLIDGKMSREDFGPAILT